MFERITVPLDGSEPAESVLPFVEQFGKLLGSEIDLIGVSEQKEFERPLRAYLDKLAAQMAGRGIKARAVALLGRAEDEIIDYAEKNKVSLIIMSARGRSGARRWDMGSVVEKVSKASNTPLLVVKERPPAVAEGGRLVNKVLVPLDGSKLGETALACVSELAARTGAEILLLQVISPTPSLMAAESYYAAYSNEMIAAQQSEAETYLRGLVARTNAGGARINYRVEVGIPSEKILETIEKEGVDLVGMSTHGRTGIKRWVYGSVAGKILSSSPVPVLLVRAAEMKR